MLREFLSNLLVLLVTIGLAVLMLTIGVIVFASIFILILFVLTEQAIPMLGWIIVILCIPCIALIKTLSDRQSE